MVFIDPSGKIDLKRTRKDNVQQQMVIEALKIQVSARRKSDKKNNLSHIRDSEWIKSNSKYKNATKKTESDIISDTFLNILQRI